MSDKKIRLMTIGDHPLHPTGVAYQTLLMVEGLLRTGKYQVMSFGGSTKHEDYRPNITEEFGDDWIIIPVDNYGTQDEVRAALSEWKPDILWLMTDPRSYLWLFDIEHEVRAKVPMVYNTIWDNFPVPKFNKPLYDSNDAIASISRVTEACVRELCPDMLHEHIPHAANLEHYKPLDPTVKKKRREEVFGEYADRMLVFWNNKNFRRKHPGTLMHFFQSFAKKVGEDKVSLVMHTNANSQHGQNLDTISDDLGFKPGQIMINTDYLTTEELGELYALCDVGINISDAEGWGLSVTESLAAGLPVIVNKTGGMQDQVIWGDEELGVAIEPCAKALIGCQVVPYIYEDRVSEEQVVDALEKMYNVWQDKEAYAELSAKCRQSAEERYNTELYVQRWDDFLGKVVEQNGSWDTRKNYTNYRIAKF